MNVKEMVINNVSETYTVGVKFSKDLVEGMVKSYIDRIHNIKHEFDLSVIFDQGYDVELVFEPTEDDSDVDITNNLKKIYPDSKTIITTAIADTLETNEFNIDIFPEDKAGNIYRVEMPYYTLENIKNMKERVS